MPVNPRRIRRGASILPYTQDILGSDEDGRKSGGVFRVVLPGLQGSDSGGTTVPHHIKYGGGCGGETLVQKDDGDLRQVEWARTRGQAPKCPLLSG